MAILVDQAKYNTLNAGNSTTEPLENGVFSKQIIALVLNNSIKDNCDEVNEAGITLDDTIQQEREAFHTIISRAGYKPATVDNQVSQSVITLISNTSTALTGNTRQMANPVSLQSGDFFNIFIDTENTQPVRITYGTIATEIPLFIKKSGTWQDSEAGTLKNGYYTIACVEGYANINSSNKTFILVSGGGGGGLSTSYNGAVVNGASSVITLTNADSDIDTYAVLKQGVKITITPDVTATANAVVTLANSNLTNTKIFCKDIDLNTYSQVGALQELKEGIPFEVTYIDNQAGVNGGLPFLLANDLSGQGFVIEIEDFQRYTASTTTDTIELTQIQGIQDTVYKNLQEVKFRADASPTVPTFAKFPTLASKEIVNKITQLPLITGQITAGRLYSMYFDDVLDKFLLDVEPKSTNADALAGTSNNTFLTPQNAHHIAYGIKLQQIIASNQANVVLNNLPNTNYKSYILEIGELVAQNNQVNLNVEFSIDNGVTWLNTGYYKGFQGRNSDGGNDTDQTSNGAIAFIGDNGGGNQWGANTGDNGNMTLNIHGCGSALKKNISGYGSYWANTNNRLVTFDCAISNTTTSIVNAIRFSFSNGNIVSGTFTLIGIK